MHTIKQETIYLDYLRIIATIAMITLHVAASGFISKDIHTYDWEIANIFDASVRWCVPVFIMISGVLFLGRDIPTKVIYKKYILRIILAFLIWSIIYILFNIHVLGRLYSNNWQEYLNTIVHGEFHLWFLPMIAGLYACIPFLQPIARNRRASKHFLCISILLSFCIPLVIKMLEISNSGGFSFVPLLEYHTKNIMSSIAVATFACYFILGYIIHNKIFTQNKTNGICLFGLVGFFFTIYMTHRLTHKLQSSTEIFYKNSNINILLESMFVFIFVKSCKFSNCLFYRKIVIKLAKYSFGAYLSHIVFLELAYKYNVMESLQHQQWLYIPIITILVAIASYAASALLNQIPKINKYIV